ncbi:PmeII family type II restriction endonuclease [Chloroflexota bacterium]
MRTEELESLMLMCLRDFYSRRLLRLKELKVQSFLARKNPYLLRAIGITKAPELIEKLLSDFVAASDETLFRDTVLEPIARVVSGGRRSNVKGIHFVVTKDDYVTAVALRSGINTMNAGQTARQTQQLIDAGESLSETQRQFGVVLGHAYGKKLRPRTTDSHFRELFGQAFWSEISGESDFYCRLMTLMQDEPSRHKEEYAQVLQLTVNKLKVEFERDFSLSDGSIDWKKIVDLVSCTRQ